MQRVNDFNPISAFTSMIRAKGAAYPMAWAHRVSGVLLVLYVLIHIDTLASLSNPEEFSRKSQMFSGALPMLLEWLLALPVIFHALNGGRLCLYEMYSSRWDDGLLRWVIYLSLGYMALLGYFMLLGNQQVTAHFFWLGALIAGSGFCAALIARIRSIRASFWWKLQRVSGGLLFVLVPAHMLFMHLNPEVGREALVIAERMGQPLIKVVDILLLSGVLYHGGFGLLTIGGDYISSRRIRLLSSAAAILVLAIFWLQGIVLIFTI